ncbi:MAG: family transcriptional regulator [Burkholderia sp.]|nr:family transcriptional regulator [Burkholderia sp.]
MPKKLLRADAVPTLVLERLRVWGNCIKKQRITQKIRAEDLCSRMGISDATLRRLEKGDPGAGVGIYLSALMILGVLDETAPMPDIALWASNTRSRVRQSGKDGDDDYF